MFKKIDPKLNLPEEEEKMLSFWREKGIFKETLKKDSPKGNFVFYEGPPTANGRPGIHHVEARSFKDLFCRYKTMKGFHVERKAGWDTHGLPVELQVEKELGISGKPQIENIVLENKTESIIKFNEICKKSVWKYKEDWEKMTERMGYWVDMENPYVTYDPKYIESVWNIISEIDKKELLYKGHKVVPYCPRCGTALSSHEVAQGYKNIKEESVYIKLKSVKEDVYFLVWTTTPWTLAGNAALAVNPKVDYVKISIENEKNEHYILAKNRVESVMKGMESKVVEEFTGKELVSRYATDKNDYEPIYEEGDKFSEAGEKSYKIISADYVSDTDGTGIVHIAPAFGIDDYEFGFQKNGIKVLKTVDEKGTELAGVGKGKFVKDADDDIKADLEKRNILFKKEIVAHDYPFCWRCESPLLYLAKDSWYIAMSKLRQELLDNNKKINWNPAYLKDGRFGNWLKNINDWAISRDRYWGTPLPIWECDKCQKYRVVSSLSEIDNVEPHKPFIDDVFFDCSCGGKMTRTPEVMDVWLDSGTMPFSQYHWPFENEEKFNEQFPADFICEGVDQTRGWFYTLLAISTLVKGESAYKNVISVGLVMDEKGKKMSKSVGNVVVPKDAFDKYGADIIRFYFYSVNQPGDTKLFSDKEMISLSRNLFMMLWNVFSFFMTYATIDKFVPSGECKSENILDKWILSKYQELINLTCETLDSYDPYKASNAIIDFVNELSTWYVRRSRRRFWKSENDTDKLSAYETLYQILTGLSKLMAPFSPMFSESLYQYLKKETDPQSIHLEEYPLQAEVDARILSDMSQARKIVEAGLSSRAVEKIKVRQPLQLLTYFGQKLDEELEEIISEEVNVKEVRHSSQKSEPLVVLETKISPELKMEGAARDLIRNIQSLRKKSDFQVEDRIDVFYQTKSEFIASTIEKQKELVSKEVLANLITNRKADIEGEEEFTIENEVVWIGIKRK